MKKKELEEVDRLTYKEPGGTLGVVGMNKNNESDKLIACVKRLEEYEKIGLSPEEVAEMKKAVEAQKEWHEKQYGTFMEMFKKNKHIENISEHDCENAEKNGELCCGYQKSTSDDEPIPQCEKCEKYSGYEMFVTGYDEGCKEGDFTGTFKI